MSYIPTLFNKLFDHYTNHTITSSYNKAAK